MNKAILIGRLTRDGELRYSTDQTAVYRNAIAVDRRFRSRDGSQQADFINLVAFGHTAEFIDKYFEKGTKIAIDGHIQTGSYKAREGHTVYTFDVVVDNAEFVEPKRSNDEPAQVQAEETKRPDADGFMEVPEGIEEELPFN